MNVRIKGSTVDMMADQWCEIIGEVEGNNEVLLNARSLGNPTVVWTIKVSDINGVRLTPTMTVGVTTGLIRHTRSRTPAR